MYGGGYIFDEPDRKQLQEEHLQLGGRMAEIGVVWHGRGVLGGKEVDVLKAVQALHGGVGGIRRRRHIGVATRRQA